MESSPPLQLLLLPLVRLPVPVLLRRKRHST